jgi:hypothetical protein
MNQEPRTINPASRIEAPKFTDSKAAVIRSVAFDVLKSEKATIVTTKVGSDRLFKQHDTSCDAVATDGTKYSVHSLRFNETPIGLITITALNPSEHPDKTQNATGLEYVICPEEGQIAVFVRNRGLINGKPDETLRQITEEAELEMVAGKLAGLQPVADVYAPAQ